MVLYQKISHIFQLSLNGYDDGVAMTITGFVDKIHKPSDSGLHEFISTGPLFVLIS
jgi:hypothetical protein